MKKMNFFLFLALTGLVATADSKFLPKKSGTKNIVTSNCLNVRFPGSGIAAGKINVSDYGAVGDGVTDDTKALQNAANALSEGDIMSFQPDKKYLISASVYITAGAIIEGNNATLFGNGNFFTTEGNTLLNVGKRLSYTKNVVGLVTKKGDTYLTLPANVTASVGDLFEFRSTDVYYAFPPSMSSFDYHKGQYALVTQVSGQKIKISSPFFDSFQVTLIIQYKGFKTVQVKNLKFDLSQTPNNTISTKGLSITGSNIKVVGCSFQGNDFAKVAMYVEGENAVIENNSIAHFFNIQGISGGGRLGYGVFMSCNNILVQNNNISDCKHAITAANRDVSIRGITVANNTINEDIKRPFKQGSLTSLHPFVDYMGSIDVHGCVSDAPLFTGNTIHCSGRAFFVRCGQAVISNNTVYQLENGVSIIGTEELPLSNLTVTKNYFEMLDNNSATCILGNYASLTDSVYSSNNINIINNTCVNGCIYNNTSLNYPINNFNIKDNILKNAVSLINVKCKIATTQTKWSIENNKVLFRSLGGNVGIDLIGQSSGTVNTTYNNLTINNNTIDASNSKGPGYHLYFSNLYLNNAIIGHNTLKSATALYNTLMELVGLYKVEFTDNIWDTLILFRTSSGPSALYTNLDVTNNEGRTLSFQERPGALLMFNNCKITGNTLKDTTGGRVLNFINSSPNGWSGSTDFLISKNKFLSASKVASVSISANSIGNKLIFKDNYLSSEIDEQSGTYYAAPKDTLLGTASQKWKGGVIVKSDGRYFAPSIPATGKWTTGDIVYNSNYSGVPPSVYFWICSSGGTPGTWSVGHVPKK